MENTKQRLSLATDEGVEEELHAEGTFAGSLLQGEDADRADDRGLTIERLGLLGGCQCSEVETLTDEGDFFIALDTSAFEDDDAVDELLKVSYLVRADEDRLFLRGVASDGSAEFALSRDVKPIGRLIEEE